MKKILIVVGTRPNFIKVTQFKRLSEKYSNLEIKIAHTGQHSDDNMAKVFFDQFNLRPDFYLDIQGKTPIQQISDIMRSLESLIVNDFTPDLIIVPGDVNSTMAVAITANKLGIPLAHLESGLRSNDREMPEEINRIITDEISDYYFITEKSGVENLRNENKQGICHFVGNTMIDTLVAFTKEIDESSILNDVGIDQKFILMTVHRPSNVDSKDGLLKLLTLIEQLSKSYQIVFPIHPRTVKNLSKFDLTDRLNSIDNLILSEALGYYQFQKLIKHCSLVITDSGGIQEETTFQQVPCLTLRENTERPITIDLGTNELVPFDVELILERIGEIERGTFKKGEIPEYWDGKATERILEICMNEILT